MEQTDLEQLRLTLAIDPHLFRAVSDLFVQQKDLYLKCNIEILEQSITKVETIEKEEEAKIETQMEEM